MVRVLVMIGEDPGAADTVRLEDMVSELALSVGGCEAIEETQSI